MSNMWRKLQRQDLGLLNLLDKTLATAQRSDARTFPDFRCAKTLLIATDYGGSHKESRFDCYSFLVLTPNSWVRWEPRRLALRGKLGLDREMSYKKLGDRHRRAVLSHFLDATGEIDGLIFSLLVAKNIPTLFDDQRRSPELRQFAHWKPGSLERMLRVTHILALLLAGLTHPRQDVFWFTDNDEIAANEARLGELTRVLGTASSHLLPHDLGHLRCGSSSSDTGTKQIEDLIAIPDLIAGSLGDLASSGGLPTSSQITPSPASISTKATEILNWFSDSGQRLRRLVLAIEKTNGSSLSVKRLRFHGTNGVAV